MSKTYSCLLVGVDVQIIEVETVLGNGFSGLNILGLPTDATRDMRERVRSALESIGIPIPARRVVVNVSSNEMIKLSRTSLSQLDFAVAACVIRALYEAEEGGITLYQPEQEFFAGELSLSGELKPIANFLIFEAVYAAQENKPIICLPIQEGPAYFEYYKNLKDWLVQRRRRKNQNKNQSLINLPSTPNNSLPFEKLSEAQSTLSMLIKNPKIAISLLTAAAGQHNLIIAGEPGIGKSFAIKHLPSFLLPLTHKEKLETKLIHSSTDITNKPFRSPHHSSTAAALVGGASLKPGEVTLSHHGVLFLDELAEFHRSSLEALREPLDSGVVTLSRANGSIIYPAQFQLCATTNPCPCGYMYSKKKPCRCNPSESRRYLQKISGPLLDRFCLQIWAEFKEEENEKLDIFAEYLKNIVRQNKMSNFLTHFFEVQSQLANTPTKKKNTKINCHFSLRGKEKMSKIAYTFAKLFPELENHKKFGEHVLQYRILSDMFNNTNYLFQTVP